MKKNIQMLIGTNMTKLDFVKHWYLKSKVTTKLSNGLESKLMKVE